MRVVYEHDGFLLKPQYISESNPDPETRILHLSTGGFERNYVHVAHDVSRSSVCNVSVRKISEMEDALCTLKEAKSDLP